MDAPRTCSLCLLNIPQNEQYHEGCLVLICMDCLVQIPRGGQLKLEITALKDKGAVLKVKPTHH